MGLFPDLILPILRTVSPNSIYNLFLKTKINYSSHFANYPVKLGTILEAINDIYPILPKESEKVYNRITLNFQNIVNNVL